MNMTDKNIIDKLAGRRRKVDQYLIRLPNCSLEYIVVSIWKAFDSEYWAHCNVFFDFEDESGFDPLYGTGETPQKALESFIDKTLEQYEKSRRQRCDVVVEQFP